MTCSFEVGRYRENWISTYALLPPIGKVVAVYHHNRDSVYLAMILVDPVGIEYWRPVRPLRNEHIVDERVIKAWMPIERYKRILDRCFPHLALLSKP